MQQIEESKIKKYKISFSEYSTFLSCPHKWYLTYCLGFPSDMNEELIFGQLVHKTLEDIFSKSSLRNPFFLEGLVKNVLKDLIKNIKDIGFLDKFNKSGLSYVFIRQAISLIKELNFFVRFKDYEILHIEYKLDELPIISFTDIEFVFKGYIDLVLQHKETGRILHLDWKTSRSKWDIKAKLKDNEDFFTQLGLYKKFYSIKNDIPINKIDVKFFNLPRESPLELAPYDGILNETYTNHLFEKLQNVCKQIYEMSPLTLKKARLITSKNYCHRCIFNKEELCNDYEEYQTVTLDIPLKSK